MRSRVLRIAAGTVAVLLIVCVGSFAYTKLRPTTVERSVVIDASAAAVWATLVDLPSYREWNPFIVSASGEVRVGARLQNTLRDNGSEMTITPEVTVAQQDRELRWIGRFGVPGVVDGEHYFLIEPEGTDRVTLTQGERFTGFLVPVAGAALDVGDGFAEMNEALKRRVE